MKKKSFVVIGAILIAVVLGAVLLFVFHGGENQADETISLQGAWLVYQHGDELPRNDFMVFNENSVSYYSNGDSEPAASSMYSIQGSQLSTPDIDKTFSIRSISENNVMLTESNSVVWRLLHIGNSYEDMSNVVPENIEGVYDVKAVGEETRINETMTFADSHLSFVQDGSEIISSDFTISDDGILHLTTIGRDYYVYENGNDLFFIGVSDNGVWELYKAE